MLCLPKIISFCIVLLVVTASAYGDPDFVRRYGEAIVEEAKLWNLLSQAERCRVYLQGTGGTLASPLPNDWRSRLQRLQDQLQIRVSGDWNKMDYDKLHSEMQTLHDQISGQLAKDRNSLIEKHTWFNASLAEEVATGRALPLCDKITYMLRINDQYQLHPELLEENSYYAGRGNWSAFKPLLFDLIQPNAWMYEAKALRGTGKHGDARQYDLATVDAVVARNAAEGYKTHVDINIPGGAGGDVTALWDKSEWPALADSLRRIAEHCRANLNVVGYEYCNEPGLSVRPRHLPLIEKALREYLAAKHKEIKSLAPHKNLCTHLCLIKFPK